MMNRKENDLSASRREHKFYNCGTMNIYQQKGEVDMEKEFLRAAGYVRVSMREQVDGHSLDAQQNNIEDYAATQGWKVVTIYTDAGISAKKDSNRPALTQLMADAKAKKFDVILVDKIDRFYRHLAGLLTALDQLRAWGISFASVQERLDFTSPWGKLMLTVLGILAEIYLDNLRQETMKGKKQRAREGYWNGLPPYGYCHGLCSTCLEPNGKGYCPEYGTPDKTDGKTLILHPIDSEIVKLAYQWYLEADTSDRLIAERLNTYQLFLPDGSSITPRAQGHPGKTTPGPFNKDLIRDMLKRIFYTGRLPYHLSHGLGSRRTLRSKMPEAELFEGKHPVVISSDVYQRVQELRKTLGTNCRVLSGFPARVFPMSTILRCGYCGKTMRGTSSKYRRYYRDSSGIDRLCDCSQPTVRADDLEKSFVGILKEFTKVWRFDNAHTDQDAAIVQAQTRYQRAKELYMAGEISRDELQVEKSRFEGVSSKLTAVSSIDLTAQVRSLGKNLDDWGRLQPVEQKKLVGQVVQSVFLRGDQVVALQPTPEFLPLFQQKSCICGEGGIRTHG
jgi:DNA invertase Pin-like site-specific DNA recombinase